MPQRKSGFSLVEILIFILLIFVLVTILLTSTVTLKKSRGSNLKSTASHIASCEIERLRVLTYTNLPANGTAPVDPSCNADLSKLPASSANRTIADYSINIKQVTVDVSWTENSIADSVQIVTLIAKNGL